MAWQYAVLDVGTPLDLSMLQRPEPIDFMTVGERTCARLSAAAVGTTIKFAVSWTEVLGMKVRCMDGDCMLLVSKTDMHTPIYAERTPQKACLVELVVARPVAHVRVYSMAGTEWAKFDMDLQAKMLQLRTRCLDECVHLSEPERNVAKVVVARVGELCKDVHRKSILSFARSFLHDQAEAAAAAVTAAAAARAAAAAATLKRSKPSSKKPQKPAKA